MMIVKTRSTGLLSGASNFTGWSSRMKQPIVVSRLDKRAWGIAKPLPRPVLPRRSRSSRLPYIVDWGRPNLSATVLEMNSRSLFLLEISVSMKIQPGDKSAEIVMDWKAGKPVALNMRESYPNPSSMQVLKKAEYLPLRRYRIEISRFN